jgi:molybdopterin-guanine dinucleotide biosynthesis protein B
MNMPPPVVSIVGMSNSGKTTFIEKLLPELTARGYRVATIKHVPRQAHFDRPDKDSFRHLAAGSQATLIASRDQLVQIRPVMPGANLADLVRLLGDDYDIVLAEGFKQDTAAKIEVHRQQIGLPLKGLERLAAIVTDEPLATKVRQFSLEDVKGVADLLEKGFIKPQRQRLAMFVNGEPLPLASFPRRIVTSTLLAIAASLKGVDKVSRLEIWMRRSHRD